MVVGISAGVVAFVFVVVFLVGTPYLIHCHGNWIGSQNQAHLPNLCHHLRQQSPSICFSLSNLHQKILNVWDSFVFF